MKKAVCVFTNNSYKLEGYVLFTELKNNMKIEIDLKGIPEGNHGFHVHECGDLREGCKSLCSHFNPHNNVHGGKDSKNRHVGDLGNLYFDSNKVCKTTMYDNRIKLSGINNIIGRGLIIHEKEDDLGKGGNKESLITGNAGKRIACGVIGICKF
jgi:Cu-Zn family superoxide dismutase